MAASKPTFSDHAIVGQRATPARRKMRHQYTLFGPWPYLVVAPALVLYLAFHLYPSLANVFFSFTNFRGNLATFRWTGLNNYQVLLAIAPERLFTAIQVTTGFGILVTGLGNTLALGLAVLLNLHLRLRTFYRAVVFLPSVLGVVVISLVWTLLLDPYFGPVNALLRSIGAESALFGDPTTAFYLAVVIQIWASVGGMMALYLAGIQAIPADLYEAGMLDGTTNWTAFWHITLPMLRPTVTINVLLTMISALRAFDLLFLLTRGGPNDATLTLGIYAFIALFDGGSSQGFAAAIGVIHFVIVFGFVLVAQHYLRRGEGEL